MRWNAIYNRIKDLYHPVGVEIGVFRGELSKNILSLHPGLSWIMIDTWSTTTYKDKDEKAASPAWRNLFENKALENLIIANSNINAYRDRALIVRGQSLEAISLFKNSLFDIVFIDAAHDYVSLTSDIINWWSLVKKGGYICGHDYEVDTCPDVKRALQDIFKYSNIELDEDFTWFVRKT